MVDHRSYTQNLSSCEIKATDILRTRRGHGLESRSALQFFSQLLKLCVQLR